MSDDADAKKPAPARVVGGMRVPASTHVAKEESTATPDTALATGLGAAPPVEDLIVGGSKPVAPAKPAQAASTRAPPPAQHAESRPKHNVHQPSSHGR